MLIPSDLVSKAISQYETKNNDLREQMKGKAIVPTWDGLPLFHRLIVLDSMITTETPCFALHHPTKIEYYIGAQNVTTEGN